MTMGLCLQITVIIYDAKPLTYQSALQYSFFNCLPSSVQTQQQASSEDESWVWTKKTYNLPFRLWQSARMSNQKRVEHKR
jgi:hypothetical protein